MSEKLRFPVTTVPPVSAEALKLLTQKIHILISIYGDEWMSIYDECVVEWHGSENSLIDAMILYPAGFLPDWYARMQQEALALIERTTRDFEDKYRRWVDDGELRHPSMV